MIFYIVKIDKNCKFILAYSLDLNINTTKFINNEKKKKFINN